MSVQRMGCIVMATCLSAAAPLAAENAGLPVLHFEDSREVAIRRIGFSEPSGLALDGDGETLWSVSDDTPALFRIGADGHVKLGLRLGKHLDDLEGIALDGARNRLLAVREKSSELIVVALADGENAERHPLSAMEGYGAIADFFEGDGETNGLEGIAIDPRDGSLWLVKEKAPRLLIRVSGDLQRIAFARILSADLGYVDDDTGDKDLDVSGIAFDPGRNVLWIVSDTGERLYQADLTGAVRGSYPLRWEKHGSTHSLKNAEGVTLGADGRTLYVVSDDKQESRLVRYGLR